MPLDNTRWGDAIAARVIALAVADTSPITPGTLQIVWRSIKDEDIIEWTANGRVKILAGDLLVPSIGYLDSVGQPVTGIAQVDPTDLDMRIE